MPYNTWAILASGEQGPISEVDNDDGIRTGEVRVRAFKTREKWTTICMSVRS